MEKFGKYEVLEKVGVGGFGVVWKAFDPLIKRTVAIKTCTSDDAEIRDRFFQEAEIAGNLQHRNVVTVYDFGVQEGVPFLVQEFLDGEDLDKKIQKKADLLPFERVSYLLQIARGLEFAHSKGVVHRDIKPANIRILDDGTAKILDFGIAKLAHRQSGLTQTGMTLGTAQYLAPEQIRGEAIDGRTDLFSFGILAFELLTYEKAFEGESLSNVIYQILHKEPPKIAQHWPEAPPEAQRVLDRCLAKEPAERYSTTLELVSDLESLGRSLRATALGPKPGDQPPPTEAPTRALALGDVLESTVAWGQAPRIDLPPRPAPHTAATRHLPIPEPEGRSRGGRVLWATLGAGALALVFAVGAAYLRRTETPSPTTSATSAKPAPVPPASAPSRSPAPSLAVAVPPPAAPQPAAPVVVTPTPVTAAEPPPPVAPPKPAAPEKGSLLVAAAWDRRITVSLDGGAPQGLDRPLKLQLAPGEYGLSWAVDLGDYRDTAKTRITVKAGATTAADVPLRPPGRLTVQAALSSPRGAVLLDGVEVGQTPMRNRAVKAGEHRLEVLPAGGAGTGAAIVETLNIHPTTQTLVTVDLARGAITSLHEKPLESGVQ
jgi:serine/threonine-protein kinase